MFNRINALILLIAIGGAVAGFFVGGWLRPVTVERVNPNALKVGAMVPSVQRPDVDGKPHSLDEWRGKLLVVNFWASWCGPCREEMPLLDRTQRRLADKGVQIVGVAADDTTATKEFLARTPVHYPVLIDDPQRNEDLSTLLGNDHSVLPYTVLVGRDGRIVARRSGSFSPAALDTWLAPHL
jgi:thiol-disulfide isomerase/thioredoxin